MSQPQVLSAVAGCLESGEYTDLRITCGDDVHKAHKMIVCTQSDFFATALRFGGKESEESGIDLQEDEPAIVKFLIRYLYTGDYNVSVPKFPHTCSENCFEDLCPHHGCGDDCEHDCQNFTCEDCSHNDDNRSVDDILVHAKMYEIADKYNITGLKELSSKKFSAGCKLHWKSASFAKAAHFALSTTVDEDKGLRDVVASTIIDHIELIYQPEIEVLMTNFGWLSYQVLLKRTKQPYRR